MNKYTIEFDMKRSPLQLLWNCISTPQGLAQWFADEVIQTDDMMKFIWDGAESEAKIVASRQLMYMRYKWLDDDHDNSCFEMRISESELTHHITLTITDWASADDMDSSAELWEHQVDILRRVIGCK